MSMEILRRDVPAYTEMLGNVNDVSISSGQYLQIRYGTPENVVELLEIECPFGKAWNVAIGVAIQESDA